MNSRFRLRPPNSTFATTSGIRIFPSSVPSGAKQCTPSPADDQRFPLVSTRNPSNSPASQVATSRPSPTDRPSAATG